jgi:hypothetical protein
MITFAAPTSPKREQPGDLVVSGGSLRALRQRATMMGWGSVRAVLKNWMYDSWLGS